MKRTILTAILLGLLWPLAANAQTRQPMSHRERNNNMRAAHTAIIDGRRGYQQGDYARTELHLERARTLLESVHNSHSPLEGEELEWLWRCYTYLGYSNEAASLYDHVSPILQERWMEDWQALQGSYGRITLASPSEVRTDPTLSLSKLEIHAPRGAREFPGDLVRRRAASRIRLAFETRDLVTEPIVVPVGANRLIFHLDRESALNYEDPYHTVDFDVRPGEPRVVQVDPRRRSVPRALLGTLGVVLITPILIAG